MGKVYPYGVIEVSAAASTKVAVYSETPVKIYYKGSYTGHPDAYILLYTTVAGENYTSSAFSSDTTVRIEAGASSVNYTIGANAAVVPDAKITRSTIANAGTITVAQHQGLCLYQDASGGAVTMTTATGANLAAALPDMAIGDAIRQYVASNHATNTSTISGGTGVTLVGSGAVTSTGGNFLLIKTAVATFDLVRVG